MFDRLGSLLSDYLDNEDTEQDIFSNTKTTKNKQEKSNQEFTQEEQNTSNKENKKEYSNKTEQTQNTKNQNNQNKTFKFDTGKQQKEKYTRENEHYFTKKSIVYSQQLIQDFTTLCVPVGSSLEKCKSSYKNLLRKYHPDKHTDNLKDQKDATEITAKINTAFNNIKGWYSTQK